MRKLLKTKSVLVALLSCSLAFVVPEKVFAQPVDNCRIASSIFSVVSLGFPVSPERLKYIPNPRILVLPYVPNDSEEFIFKADEKNKFLQAAKDIRALSSNLANIEFIFNSTVKLSMTKSEIDNLAINTQKTWLNDFENNPHGFALKVIQDLDKSIDYTGIDGVVLYGFASTSIGPAQALQFTNDMSFVGNAKKRLDGKNWFAPIQTNENVISNAVFLPRSTDAYIITHEILHNYGLTDLYGGERKPPLSIMSMPGNKLLPFEKWVLGWLPDANVTCVNAKSELVQSPTANRFVFDYSKGDQSLVIPTGLTTALIVDVSGMNKQMLFYSLDNDKRPPIEMFSSTNNSDGSVSLTGYSGIGEQLKSPEYTVLISDNDGSSVTINLIPNSAIGSEDSLQLITLAAAKKIEKEILIKDKQESEAKAPALKKKTITCVKGKLVKKVVAVKPKCPSGFKKK